jgi:hypothetical protein
VLQDVVAQAQVTQIRAATKQVRQLALLPCSEFVVRIEGFLQPGCDLGLSCKCFGLRFGRVDRALLQLLARRLQPRDVVAVGLRLVAQRLRVGDRLRALLPAHTEPCTAAAGEQRDGKYYPAERRQKAGAFGSADDGSRRGQHAALPGQPAAR